MTKPHSHIFTAQGSSFSKAASSHVYLCVVAENTTEGVLFDELQGEVVGYFHLPKTCESKEELEEILPSKHPIKHLATASHRFCLTPKVLFNSSSAEQHLQMHFKSSITDVRSQEIEDLDALILFEAHGDFESQYPIYAAIIQGQRLITHLSEDFQVYLHFFGEQMSISIFKNKGLMYFNAFEGKSEEDIMYFLLYVLDQLEISSSKIRISYSGSPTIDLKNAQLLKGFIPRIEAIKLPGNVTVNPELKINNERLFALVSLYICA